MTTRFSGGGAGGGDEGDYGNRTVAGHGNRNVGGHGNRNLYGNRTVGVHGNRNTNTNSNSNVLTNSNTNSNVNLAGVGDFSSGGESAREQLAEIAHVVFKRKRLIGLVFLIIFVPGVLLSLLRSAQYVATAKVNIAPDRAEMTISSTDVNSLNVLKLNEAVVNSEVHILKSRELLEEVVRGLATQQAQGGVVGLARADGGEVDIGARVNALASQLKVMPIRASNVIQVDFASSDQAYATRLVNRVVDEYLKRHASVHGQPRLGEFYDGQSQMLEQNLTRAQESLREFTSKEGIAAPEQEINVQVVALARMEQDLREINGQIAASEEKIRTVREQLAEQPVLVKRGQTLDVNPVVKKLTEHLVERKVGQVTLLRKYTEKDRHVRDNAEEISQLQGELDVTMRDQPTVITQQVYQANPLYDSGLSKLLEVEAMLRGDRARKQAIEEDLARSRRQLVTLKQKALEFDRLDKDVERRRASLEVYEHRAQQARVADAMDQEKLVNVEVVSRPALPLNSASNRGVSFLLTLISAAAVSLGFAFGLEYLSRTLRFEKDVERHLGLPVLGTIAEAK